jgi:hypothetical protein
VSGCWWFKHRLLPQLAEIAQKTDFKEHVYLQETLWKQLPMIGEGVGKSESRKKKNFKNQLQPFIAPMHKALSFENNLARASAEMCAQQVSKMVGPTIFKGR